MKTIEIQRVRNASPKQTNVLAPAVTFVSNPVVDEFKTVPNALRFAFGIYQDTVLGEGLSYICFLIRCHSLLSMYPEKMAEDGLAFANEYSVRTLTYNILADEPLVRLFFDRDTILFDTDLEELAACFGHDECTADSNLFLKLHPDAREEIVKLVNSKWKGTTGLLNPKISIEDFTTLITTGQCRRDYTCNNNSYFAHFLKKLKDYGLISPYHYLAVTCSGGRLYSNSKDRSSSSKPRQLDSYFLSATLGNIYDKRAPYKDMSKAIESLAKRWLDED